MNPFSSGKIVFDDDFCNRKEEIKTLSKYAVSGVNTVIYSPRRFGKTSLVKKIQKSIDIQSFYCDFFGVVSAEDIVNRIISSIINPVSNKKNSLKKILDFFKLLRPVVNYDTLNNSYSVSIDIDKKSPLNSIEYVIKSLNEMSAKTQQNFLIIFDEFQEITEIKDYIAIEGLMRTVIQESKNISFFFVGSRRRILLEMFTDKKRPFFHSSILFELKKIPEKEFSIWIKEKFKTNGIDCSDEQALKILSLVKNYPFYVQKLCFYIYSIIDGNTLLDNHIDTAFELLIEEEKRVTEMVLQSLSNKQKEVLYALSLEKTDRIMNNVYLTKHNLIASTVQSVLIKLENLDLISKNEYGFIEIVNPIHEINILRMFQSKTN
ncbi:MAG: ATP-binding protein [Candidatus Muiribacteriota bacterium]